MTDNHPADERLDKTEWQRRFAARIMERAQWPEIPAMQCAAAAVEEWDEMLEDFHDDPEGAADEEMSCWTDDGDE